MSKKLKDRLWLWGQTPGSHHASRSSKIWKLPGINRMTPIEGANYLGIPNMCRVVMGGNPAPPFDSESEQLCSMKEVVWSAIGDRGSVRNNDDQSDLDEVLRQAAIYPNITGVVLDDFFKPDSIPPLGTYARHSLDSIRTMKDRLARFPGRALDFWLVWYKHELEFDVDEYLALFDIITYWNMDAPAQSAQLDEDIATVVKKTPGKRRFAGCYMWNYGEGKPLSIEEITLQCETYYRWIGQGYIEGIIFCSNCCADLDLEAVEWVRNWIQEKGDTPV